MSMGNIQMKEAMRRSCAAGSRNGKAMAISPVSLDDLLRLFPELGLSPRSRVDWDDGDGMAIFVETR